MYHLPPSITHWVDSYFTVTDAAPAYIWLGACAAMILSISLIWYE
jgi:hypothetical protein